LSFRAINASHDDSGYGNARSNIRSIKYFRRKPVQGRLKGASFSYVVILSCYSLEGKGKAAFTKEM
jgi:hypothetical protein